MTDDQVSVSEAMFMSHLYGMSQEQERIIDLFKNSDSACSEWAIAVIKGEQK